jgi:hypothetical protein
VVLGIAGQLVAFLNFWELAHPYESGTGDLPRLEYLSAVRTYQLSISDVLTIRPHSGLKRPDTFVSAPVADVSVIAQTLNSQLSHNLS